MGYNLRMAADPRSGHTFMMCRSSFLNTANLGAEILKGLLGTRFEPGPNLHGNGFNKNACVSDPVRHCIVNCIREKGEHHGECYVTRTLLALMTYELSDEEKGAANLTSTFTKRNMYEKY
jgi:hypothetical protein